MSNVNEKTGVGEGLNEFIQKNRRSIFVSLGIIILGAAVCVAALFITDALRTKAIGEVEELSTRYEALRPSIAKSTDAKSTDAKSADANPDDENTGDTDASSAADIEALLGDLNAFAKKTSGYSGGTAWSIIAGIHGEKKEWPEAEAAWKSAAGAASKTYLAAVAWFNAGAAAEEQGRLPEAVAYYEKSAALDFPSAARAQFSVGRLREAQNDTAAALETYRTLISNWPNDTVWTNFARDRVIALEAVKAGE